MDACANVNRSGSGGSMGKQPKRYTNYRDLLSAEDIDAVIIATPDHWHAAMTIEAARAGKHVYCEKPMTNSIPETYEVVQAVRENNIVYQLGHQNRQIESYQKAKEVVKAGFIGKVNLVEVTTNRNDPNGAWIYPIPKEASQQNIDWDQFIGPAPYHTFSLERFFRWRCWWDYATGLSGDLFTHEYDSMNQILELGIPYSAVASGGNYFYRDGRTTPDVLQMAFEYPQKELSLLYSASLASNWNRSRAIMGNDGIIELDSNLQVYADSGSKRYEEKIKNRIIDPDKPIYSFTPGLQQVDAISSATAQYFAKRGLLYTYRNGKRVNTAHLHIKEWLECIRHDGTPSCHVDTAFEEAITAHMGTLAYRENRKVFWDEEKNRVV
jgi:predicted dehydrogenase